jgi:anti-sigma factor RsiW
VTCEEVRTQLGAYVLGGLEPEEAAAVREHLDRCPECARE